MSHVPTGFAKRPRSIPPTEYTLTHHLSKQLEREKEHIGEWLGVGASLPVPITSGPPGHSSDDYSPSRTIVDAEDATDAGTASGADEERFRSVHASGGPSHEDGLSISMPRRVEEVHEFHLQRIRIPKELLQAHRANAYRDPLGFDAPPPMASAP